MLILEMCILSVGIVVSGLDMLIEGQRLKILIQNDEWGRATSPKPRMFLAV